MRLRISSLLKLGFFVLFLSSCNRGTKENNKETILGGSTSIVVDDTFYPIVEAQLDVFQSTYTTADIKLVSRPENELLKLFLSDSIHVAIMSRQLTPSEAKFYENRKIIIKTNRFAIDALAIITSQSTKDTSVTVNDLIKAMRGEGSKIKMLVFDNPNSSTVRYLKELSKVSVLPTSGVYAMKSNSEVIKYVSEHEGAFGVVGINWIDQPDSITESYMSKIKILPVQNSTNKGYYRPNQNDLALNLYPLTRNLYIINGQGSAGLGMGFASFLAGERGQRIVLKSGLLPDSIPSREIIIRKNVN